MANDSSTGGPLAPAPTPAPLEGKDLDRFLQQFVVGITGMTPTAVRPRWQLEPPNTPELPDSWAAVGVHDRRADTFATERHRATGDGENIVFRQEFLDVLVSFYGPDAGQNAALLRDGLSVAQNREALTNANISLTSTGDVLRAPTLVGSRWQNRCDITLYLARAVLRVYPVLSLASAHGTIITDNDPPLSESIDVEQL